MEETTAVDLCDGGARAVSGVQEVVVVVVPFSVETDNRRALSTPSGGRYRERIRRRIGRADGAHCRVPKRNRRNLPRSFPRVHALANARSFLLIFHS